MKKGLLCILLALLIVIGTRAENRVIVVKNQVQFDALNEAIHKAAQDGVAVIEVRISRGTYYFHENHLKIGDIRKSDLKLVLKGIGAVLVAEGRDVKGESNIIGYDFRESVVDVAHTESIDPWSETYYASADVEVLDTKTKLCRLRCNELPRNTMQCKDAWIMLTAWCRTYYYKIEYIKDGYVYFTAENLGTGIDWGSVRKGFNVNNDWIYGNVMPRYRLCNLTSVGEYSRHVCEVQTFLSDVWGQLKSLTLSGFTFLGNKTIGDADSSASSLIILNNVKAETIEIRGCRFIGQNSRVIAISMTDGVVIRNNLFRQNFRDGISSYNSSKETRVEANNFEKNGTDMSSNRCVSCSGEDYYIGRNSFLNFGYCAISVGVPYASGREHQMSCGVVEYNTLRYDSVWMTEPWKYNIMDSGAIYLWTQNDGAVIRYNTIDGYNGAGDNRGIFCDDGASGFDIYGNTVRNIPNSYCIDSRRFASCEDKVGPTNLNNSIRDNVVDGRIRFQGREQVGNGCELGTNYFLVEPGEAPGIINTYNNVCITGEDTNLHTKGQKRGKVVLERKYYKMLKKSNEWNGLKIGIRR